MVNLCIKHNVPRLIYTSSASVTLTSYLGLAPFAVVVNLTESKTKPVTADKEILVPGYSVTKFRAEKIVLGANGTNLANSTGNINEKSSIVAIWLQIEWPFYEISTIFQGLKPVSWVFLILFFCLFLLVALLDRTRHFVIFGECRRTHHDIDSANRILWRRRSILFPVNGKSNKENRRHYTESAGRWRKASNDLCRWVNWICRPFCVPLLNEIFFVYFLFRFENVPQEMWHGHTFVQNKRWKMHRRTLPACQSLWLMTLPLKTVQSFANDCLAAPMPSTFDRLRGHYRRYSAIGWPSYSKW